MMCYAHGLLFMTKGLYHSLFMTLDISKATFFNTVNTPRATASLQPDMRKDCFLCSTIVLLAFTKANYRVRLFGLRSTLLHSARRLPGVVHDVHDKISCSRVSNVKQVHSTGSVRANCKFWKAPALKMPPSMFFKWPLWSRNFYMYSCFSKIHITLFKSCSSETNLPTYISWNLKNSAFTWTILSKSIFRRHKL